MATVGKRFDVSESYFPGLLLTSRTALHGVLSQACREQGGCATSHS